MEGVPIISVVKAIMTLNFQSTVNKIRARIPMVVFKTTMYSKMIKLLKRKMVVKITLIKMTAKH